MHNYAPEEFKVRFRLQIQEQFRAVRGLNVAFPCTVLLRSVLKTSSITLPEEQQYISLSVFKLYLITKEMMRVPKGKTDVEPIRAKFSSE